MIFILFPSNGMSAQRQFGHRVIVSDKANRLCVADFVNNVDATACLFNAKAATSKDFLVTLRMQLRKALAELKFLPVNLQGTVSTLLPFHGVRWKRICIDTEKITYTGTL